MKDARIVTLPLSKEVLDRTPLEVIDLLLRLLSRVEELESRLSKHSGNSNKPPSSDSPFRKRGEEKSSKRSARKRAGFRQKLLTPTETTPLLPQLCPCGGTRFTDMEPFYAHQVFGLPKIDAHIEHLVLHRARCADCGLQVKAMLPLKERTGYGPRLLAMIVELAGCHGDSRVAQDFLFSDAQESDRSIGSARSSLSLSLSLKLYILTVAKAACSQGCFLSFSGRCAWRNSFQPQGM